MSKPQEKIKTKAVSGATKRNFTASTAVTTDLFKLETAIVTKYEGWNPDQEPQSRFPAKYTNWEHTHPFRTYDKNGVKQTYSTPIGGHFHVIEWKPSEDPNEPPTIISVSGPMVMSKKRIKGQMVSVPVPANDFDEHTHEVSYLTSSEVKVSARNTEALKLIAMEAAKTAPVDGVKV